MMNENLQNYLVNKYKKLFDTIELDGCSFFDIECDAGWFHLINDLLTDLINTNVKILSIKEKYGELTVYYHSEDNCVLIDTIINDYRMKSIRICEICGHSGSIKQKSGWFKTLCQTCSIKHEFI